MWRTCWALSLTACASAFHYPMHLPEVQDGLVVDLLPAAPADRPFSELRVVDSVIPLVKGNAPSQSSALLNAMRKRSATKLSKRLSSGTVQFTDSLGSIYLAPVTVGGTEFQVVIDTGSSDPWLVAEDFTCFDVATNEQQDQSYCDFGPLYDPTTSRTYSRVPGENFNVSYVDKENLIGNMGLEAMGMAGITVPQQKFGIVEKASWFGDGISSGLVGFAYSTLTNAYVASDPSQDSPDKRINYPTLFTNMIDQNLAAPVFSIALSRDTNEDGVMAIGGLPNIPHAPYFTSAPIQPVGVNSTDGKLVYQFYTVLIEGFAVSSSPSAQFNVAGTQNSRKVNLLGNGTSTVIDSGTSLVYVNDDVAAAFAAAFDPPAFYLPDLDSYGVDCNAVPPVFGVSIGRKILYVNGADMFFASGSPDTCYLSIQPNGGGHTVLGDVFLKNVLAVFDIGAGQMRFAAREYSALGL